MTPMAKLALGAGAGVLTTLVTDAALRYFASPADEQGEINWYYKHSALLGGAVSIVTAGVIWKAMNDKEAALVCAIAGVGSALVIPAREYVMDAKQESLAAETPPSSLPEGLRGFRGAALGSGINKQLADSIRATVRSELGRAKVAA